MYKISKKELNGLKYMYWQALHGYDNYKGLKRINCFKAVQEIKNLGNKISDIDIDKYIIVEERRGY